jgi:hypothetical protein
MPLRRSAVWLVLWLALTAHAPSDPSAGREIVRIQGQRGAAVDGGGPAALVVSALGTEYPFAASDLRVFGFSAGDAAASVGPKVTLQGSRDLLSRFANARPDQTITILAERRAGSSDLFLLALDLCPAK